MYAGNYSRISGVLGESCDLSFPLTAAMSQPCLARVAVFWLYWLLCWPWPSYVANPLVPSSFLPVPFVRDWMLWWDYAILESALREAAFLWWCSAFSAVALIVFPVLLLKPLSSCSEECHGYLSICCSLLTAVSSLSPASAQKPFARCSSAHSSVLVTTFSASTLCLFLTLHYLSKVSHSQLWSQSFKVFKVSVLSLSMKAWLQLLTLVSSQWTLVFKLATLFGIYQNISLDASRFSFFSFFLFPSSAVILWEPGIASISLVEPSQGCLC